MCSQTWQAWLQVVPHACASLAWLTLPIPPMQGTQSANSSS